MLLRSERLARRTTPRLEPIMVGWQSPGNEVARELQTGALAR
jgi:hypothetical protein